VLYEENNLVTWETAGVSFMEIAVPFTYGSTMYFVEYIWKDDQISGG